MQASILDMSTTFVRPTVRIDGATYELRHPDELSLSEQHALQVWGKEIEDAFKDSSDGENVSKGEHALRNGVGLLLPHLPAEVNERLSDTQRLAILQGFTRLASASILASAPTGGDSSRGSNDSTAGGPTTGSDAPVS